MSSKRSGKSGPPPQSPSSDISREIEERSFFNSPRSSPEDRSSLASYPSNGASTGTPDASLSSPSSPISSPDSRFVGSPSPQTYEFLTSCPEVIFASIGCFVGARQMVLCLGSCNKALRTAVLSSRDLWFKLCWETGKLGALQQGDGGDASASESTSGTLLDLYKVSERGSARKFFTTKRYWSLLLFFLHFNIQVKENLTLGRSSPPSSH